MKKLLAIILISLMLLSSCADADKSGAGGGDAPFDVLLITNKTPYEDPYYKSDDPPASIDYINEFWDFPDIEYYNILSYKPDIEFKGRESGRDPSFCGIIDNEKKFKSYYEDLTNYKELTNGKYEDRFPENFFDDCFILLICYICDTFEPTFVKVDYTFEPDEKGLNLTFTTRPHEGWLDCPTENVGTSVLLVPIAKKDVVVDGKLVRYEDLNIEVNYMLTDE